jgi:predicted amidohydrolase
MEIKPYQAVAIQPNYRVINHKKDIKKYVLPRYLDLIDHSIEWLGLFGPRVGNPPIKLFTFPEFAFQGWDYCHAPTFSSIKKNQYGPQEQGLKVAVEMPGDETDLLSQKAKEYQVYISGAALEYDPQWEGRFFNTAFIIAPDGQMIHKYRKVNSTNSCIGISTSPYDILDEYMEKYGENKSISEVLFPVTETSIGRLGTYTCWDRQFPEVARALMVGGGEVLIHPIQTYTGSFRSGEEVYRINNQMRALENCVYIISSNSARTINDPPNFPTKVPEQWSCGHSMIVDYWGKVIAEANSFGEEVISSVIDVASLRRRRCSPGYNMPAQLLSKVYLDVYQRLAKMELGIPPNVKKDTIKENVDAIYQSIDRFHELGVFVKPEE